MKAEADHKNMPVRCESDNPNRCQANAAHGQCPFLSVPGSKYCPIHGGKDNTKANNLYDLRYSEARRYVNKFKDHPAAKTLSTELAMLRLLLQSIWNRCTDDLSILQNAASISKLVMEISALQQSNTRLEKQLGDLLSTKVVMQLVHDLFNTIIPYIPDPDDRESIANQFQALIDKAILSQAAGAESVEPVQAPLPRIELDDDDKG